MLRRAIALLPVALGAALACEPYGSTQASTADAGTSSDAGDADAGGQDAAGGACTRTFEEKFDLVPAWTRTETTGASIDVQSGELVASVTAQSSSSQAQVRLELPGTGLKSARLAFKTRVPEYDVKDLTVGCSLRLDADDTTRVAFGAYVDQGQLNVDDEIVVDGSEVLSDPGVGIGVLDHAKVYAMEIDVRSITETTAHATITVDGRKAIDRDVALPAPTKILLVKCGIDYAAQGVTATVAVDDATLDVCR